MFILKRILMAEADAATGSGSPAPAGAPASQENVPQAQGAAPMTKEIADAVAAEVSKLLPALRDSLFAEARRTFTEKKSAKATAPVTEPATPATPALDPGAERRALRAFDRTLTQLGLSEKINANQWARAEKLLLEEQPEDVVSWVKDYFEGYGAASPAPAPQAQTQQQAAQQQTRPQNEHPVTDRGAPSSSKAPLEEANLFDMSDADRNALIKEKGPVWFRSKLQEQSRGKKLAFGP